LHKSCFCKTCILSPKQSPFTPAGFDLTAHTSECPRRQGNKHSHFFYVVSSSELPDFSWYMIPKPEKCTK
jgi:hypothetical protein